MDSKNCDGFLQGLAFGRGLEQLADFLNTEHLITSVEVQHEEPEVESDVSA
jgi:hypothetical protein